MNLQENPRPPGFGDRVRPITGGRAVGTIRGISERPLDAFEADSTTLKIEQDQSAVEWGDGTFTIEEAENLEAL